MHLTCRCCTIEDLRQPILMKELANEMNNPMSEFDQDSLHFHGHLLTGKYKHFCNEFDGLPIDETCIEFAYCLCFQSTKEVKDLQYKQHLVVERLNGKNIEGVATDLHQRQNNASES